LASWPFHRVETTAVSSCAALRVLGSIELPLANSEDLERVGRYLFDRGIFVTLMQVLSGADGLSAGRKRVPDAREPSRAAGPSCALRIGLVTTAGFLAAFILGTTD
jgi:hypothetical protein